MATIKDIARLAGVGIGTVSRVINGGEKVKPSTQERVMKAAEKLNYRPNKGARNLVLGKSDTIVFGVLLPSRGRELHFEILKGILTYIMETGLNFMVFNVTKDKEENIQKILHSGVSGLLVLEGEFTTEEERIFKMARIPLVYLDNDLPEQSCIYINNRLGGSLAAEHLISRGVKNPAYIGAIPATPGQTEQLDGFREELAQRGLEIAQDIRVPLGDIFGYNETKKILSQAEVDGIFFSSDEFAYGAFRVFREAGSGLPIIGYGDLPTSRILALSSIRQPSHSLGYEGCQILWSLIHHESDHVIRRELQPEYMQRKS